MLQNNVAICHYAFGFMSSIGMMEMHVTTSKNLPFLQSFLYVCLQFLLLMDIIDVDIVTKMIHL